MIITISGLPGSGKSTVGRMLAKKLGYKFYSTGDIRGKIAMGMGITIDELNEIGKREFWTDDRVDKYVKHLGETKDNIVIDSWLAFNFIPHSFKVFLDVHEETGAKRVFKDQRPDEARADSEHQLMKRLKKRVKDTHGRYRKYYDLDFQDRQHYDLVIDTTGLKPSAVVGRVIKAIGKMKKRG